MKKAIFFILAVLIAQHCNATQLYMDLPSGFPSTMPIPGNIITRPTTHAFFEKWAQSIKNNKQEINLKTLDKSYQGIGLWEAEEFHYEPNISLTNNSNIDCTLYSGLMNKNAYNKLKSPMLYDSKNKICVAVTGWRDYSKTQNPYFEEPKDFEQIVYVIGNLPQTKSKPFDLREVILLPSNLENSKQEEKYIKNINKLYDKSASRLANGNSLTGTVSNTLGSILLLPLAILSGGM